MDGGYRTRHGVDWPAEMSDELIDLTVAKKWRQFRAEYGVTFRDPWEPLLSAARSLLSRDVFRISPWTEEHFHDFVMYDEVITWGCASCSKSNDYGLLLVLDWLVDPYDTVSLLCSTTKEDLKSRSWESVVRYHAALRNNARGLAVPGHIMRQGQRLVNEETDDVAGSGGEKAGIQGRALNEEGRLQGAHAKYVRLVVDELAAVTCHDTLATAITNLRIGTVNFKFMGLANPVSWEDPSCAYCMPPGGPDTVDVDTGTWTSTRGYFVRHHDGLKSPCILRPELRDEFPFLITQADVDKNLLVVDGNRDAPQMWKMVRGFPAPSAMAAPTVLDLAVAKARGVDEPYAGTDRVLASAGGIDPAWSEGGDGAVAVFVRVREGADGKPYLDFTGGMAKLKILASDERPVTKQLLDQVVLRLREGGAPGLEEIAVDASANQGLADAMDIFMGPGCLHVNYATRASEDPLRAFETKAARETLHDRGTESWAVLAEFCRAGQVKGLPAEALRALTSRRYACKSGTMTPTWPLRMETKEAFRPRFKRSPDECDACALAALAVKERLGIAPFGYVVPPRLLGGTPGGSRISMKDNFQAVPERDTGGAYDGYGDAGPGGYSFSYGGDGYGGDGFGGDGFGGYGDYPA